MKIREVILWTKPFTITYPIWTSRIRGYWIPSRTTSTSRLEHFFSKEYKYIDLGLELLPFDFDSWYDSLRTAWMKSEATYFVVPVLPMPETSISADFFIVILLSITVVFIFWIVTRRLGMTSYPWRVPRRTAERILLYSSIKGEDLRVEGCSICN